MSQNARLALWVPSDENPAVGNVIASEALTTPKKVINTKFSSASGIADAPVDTKFYARKDAGWVEITDPASITTQLAGKVAKAGDTMTGQLNVPLTPSGSASATSKQYVDSQVASAAGVPDAPSNGTVYGRKNATWVDVTTVLPAIIDGGTF